MKNFNSIIRSIFVASIVMFTASCSDQDEEVMNSADMQISLEAEKKAASNASKAKMYSVEISALNGSGVSGTGELSLIGDQLTVKIYANGLEANQLHIQHIHGFTENNANSVCPPPSADQNGDGLVDLSEGAPFYGPVLLSLTPFPTAPDGTIVFEQTYTVDTSITPLQNRVIVIHGMTVDGEYQVTLPVACGQIKADQGNK